MMSDTLVPNLAICLKAPFRSFHLPIHLGPSLIQIRAHYHAVIVPNWCVLMFPSVVWFTNTTETVEVNVHLCIVSAIPTRAELSRALTYRAEYGPSSLRI